MALRKRLTLKAAMLASAAMLPGTALAQIDVITVTAERKTENLQDVSLSVSAFDEEGLQRGGIEDVSRLELLVPGVNFAFTGNDAKFNVRGANSSNTFGDNTSIVGTFVDGVYKARASQQSRAFFDVERVEFLKGPQGTLYGRNTFAGALNLYTKKPDMEGYAAGIEYGYSSFDRSRFEGYFNAPVSDTFALRVAAFSDKSDGYIKNFAGPDIGAQDDEGIRISALWQASDTLELLARYSVIQESGREAGLFGYTFVCRNETPDGLTDPFGSVRNCDNPVRGSGGRPNADQLGPYNVAQDYVPPVDLREDVVQLEANWDAGSVLVKSITSYTDYKNNIGFDFDFGPNPNSNGGYDEELESFTQEFQLSSNYDSALQWTAGLYYADEELFQSFSIYQETQRDDSTRPTVIGPNGQPFTVLQGTDIISRDRFIGGFFADSQIINTEALGVYGQAEYSFTDQFRLIAGLRYSEEDKELTGGGSNFTGDVNGDGMVDRVVNVVPGAAGSSPVVLPDSSIDFFTFNFDASDAIIVSPDKFDNVTYRLGFEYDLNPDVLLYFTTSTGFLSGALSTNGATDEQESEVFEAGFKSILADGTLQLNGAFHFTKYDNLLTQLQIPVGGIVQTVSVNGGEIEATGVELDAVWVPMDNLTLSGNIAYLDSEFTRFGQNNPYQLFNGQVQPFIDVSGETTPWSPEFTLSASAAYEFDLGENGTITPYLQFYYSDEYNTSNLLAIDPAQQQDSFTKTDFRVTWDTPIENLSIEGFVENIEDEAVLARGNNNSDDIVQTSFLYPRNAGFRVRATF